jgi:hypothetical protein
MKKDKSRQGFLKNSLLIAGLLVLPLISVIAPPAAESSKQCAVPPTLVRYFCDRSRAVQCGYTLTTCCRPAPVHEGCTTAFSTTEIVPCGYEPGGLLLHCAFPAD